MRHLIKIFLALILVSLPSYPAIKGKLEYSIPIDYSKLSNEELDAKAGFYYNLALKTYNGKINEEMTNALNLHKILQSKNPENTFYNLRLGHLYDIAGMDKFAKGCFYAAIGTDPSQAEPYFQLGEFYYKRELYRRALKFYKQAYKQGFSTHYETLYKLGDVYGKLGDTQAALKYLKLAAKQNPNIELDKKIQRFENANLLNREYYSNTRIHF